MANKIKLAICRQCEKKAGRGRRVSARGLCNHCCTANMKANATALQSRSGPAYQKWLLAQKVALERQIEAANKA